VWIDSVSRVGLLRNSQDSAVFSNVERLRKRPPELIPVAVNRGPSGWYILVANNFWNHSIIPWFRFKHMIGHFELFPA
jgi:hypothetical protein